MNGKHRSARERNINCRKFLDEQSARARIIDTRQIEIRNAQRSADAENMCIRYAANGDDGVRDPRPITHIVFGNFLSQTHTYERGRHTINGDGGASIFRNNDMFPPHYISAFANHYPRAVRHLFPHPRQCPGLYFRPIVRAFSGCAARKQRCDVGWLEKSGP